MDRCKCLFLYGHMDGKTRLMSYPPPSVVKTVEQEKAPVSYRVEPPATDARLTTHMYAAHQFREGHLTFWFYAPEGETRSLMTRLLEMAGKEE